MILLAQRPSINKKNFVNGVKIAIGEVTVPFGNVDLNDVSGTTMKNL